MCSSGLCPLSSSQCVGSETTQVYTEGCSMKKLLDDILELREEAVKCLHNTAVDVSKRLGEPRPDWVIVFETVKRMQGIAQAIKQDDWCIDAIKVRQKELGLKPKQFYIYRLSKYFDGGKTLTSESFAYYNERQPERYYATTLTYVDRTWCETVSSEVEARRRVVKLNEDIRQ